MSHSVTAFHANGKNGSVSNQSRYANGRGAASPFFCVALFSFSETVVEMGVEDGGEGFARTWSVQKKSRARGGTLRRAVSTNQNKAS